MSKNPTPNKPDKNEEKFRDLLTKFRVTQAKLDKLEREADRLRAEVKESQDDEVRFAQLEQAIKESQKIARAVSIRLALLASSFGSFAWMLTLWVNRPADAGLLYDLTIAFFGVISVVFLLTAFKDELRNKFKSWFKRRRD